MSAEESDAQTIGELARELRRFRVDLKEDLDAIKAAVGDTVRRDVYLAEKQLLESRIAGIEQDRLQDRERANRAIQLAVGGLLLPLIAGIVLAIVSWSLTRRG